jgi:hypothetical protein
VARRPFADDDTEPVVAFSATRNGSARMRLSHPLFSGSQLRPVFHFRARFCHSRPMETHAVGFRLRADVRSAKSDFLSALSVVSQQHAAWLTPRCTSFGRRRSGAAGRSLLVLRSLMSRIVALKSTTGSNYAGVDGMVLSTANIYFTAHDRRIASVFRTAQSATPGQEAELCREPDCRFSVHHP